MNIYFFSTHTPDSKDLGASTAQFRNKLADIHIRGNLMSFTETMYIDGQRVEDCYTVPSQSVVIVEASPLLQEAWLAARVSALEV